VSLSKKIVVSAGVSIDTTSSTLGYVNGIQGARGILIRFQVAAGGVNTLATLVGALCDGTGNAGTGLAMTFNVITGIVLDGPAPTKSGYAYGYFTGNTAGSNHKFPLPSVLLTATASALTASVIVDAWLVFDEPSAGAGSGPTTLLPA
jgi:hypothetical protein